MKPIIMDRDGVINEDSDTYIKTVDEWVPIAGSLEAIALLTYSGYSTVVATNQSGLARGLFDGATLAAMHEKMLSKVEALGGAIAGVFVCPHGPNEGCNCRKPATGLFEQIEAELQCKLAGNFMIGDSLKDVQAAVAYDMRPVLVRTGKGLKTESLLNAETKQKVPVYDNLRQAVEHLILPETVSTHPLNFNHQHLPV